jgi:Carbohydrate binding module (family 6)
VEAESGTCDGTIDTEHVGFSGTGYCNTTNSVGASSSVTVDATAAGPTELRFGYANGTTADRPATLRVNGVAVGTVNFPGTGAWTSYGNATVTAPLAAGTNTIRLEATTAAGLSNIDYVDVASTGPPPVTFQAEECTISGGAVESAHTGFTGTGYVNTNNAVGPFVECTVTGSATSLAVRYANGVTTNRPMTLTVDGTAAGTVNFPGTGAWTTWGTATAPVSLADGTHTIRLTTTTADGGPNLDSLTLG